MSGINVVLLEPTEDFHSHLTDRYHHFFHAAGYEAQIDCVINQQQLHKRLNKGIVDVVIADLLFKTKDFAGLVVVQALKKEYPEIFCIGNSQADVSYGQTALKLPTFDMFIEKGGLLGNDKIYIDNMVREFRCRFRRNTGIEIDDTSVLPKQFTKARASQELHSLLAQVTFSSHDQDLLLNGTNIQLIPLAGGRSRSYVFKMVARNPISQIAAVPAVLKISEREYATRELNNYNRFVRWIVPYSWRVDLLGAGFTKNYGALCYSFILSDYEEFDSLTRFMSEGRRDVVEGVLGKIFNPGLRRWYAEELIQTKENISERYMSRYFPTGSSKDSVIQLFPVYCQEAFSNTIVTKSYVEVFGNRYPLPYNRLFGQPHNSYESCICHGDLNSNNVIVARNNEVIFIDFQYTGRGHVFEDFITMESSLRMYYCDRSVKNSEIGWEDNIRLENAMDVPDKYASLPPVYQLMADVRSKARDNFPTENFKTYYYGVAAYNCRLLRIPNLSLLHKGKIISAILAALKRIEE